MKDTALLHPAGNPHPDQAVDAFNLGRAFKEQGQLIDAAACFQKAMQLDPQYAAAAFQTGNIFLQQGNLMEAVAWYQRGLKINPEHVDAQNNLGSVFNQQGNFEAAAACFTRVITLEPEFAEAHFNLGLALKNQGKLQAAMSCYRRALQLNPRLVEAHYALGILLRDQSRLQEAIACFQRSLQIAPSFAEAHYNLGLTFFNQGQLGKAAGCYRQALQLKPDFAEALNNLGLIFKDRHSLSEAVACYQQALRINPNLAQAHYNMGIALQLQGKYQEGLRCHAQALKIDPNYAPARWLFLLGLPVIYNSEAEIHACRQRFQANLDFLTTHTRLDTPAQRKRALEGVGSTTNFFLPYQGRNDLALQSQYGQFVARVMAANYPQWALPRSVPRPPSNGKIRIGYVSSFMRAHTVGEFLLGWLQNHHRDQLEIYGYHIGCQTDVMTVEIQKNCDHFYQIGPGIEQAAARIIADNLHILTYTDIGMNAPATQLAGLRLAAIQCKGWGHPVTTGLPTIDYYLSSDLMEPENGQDHYREKLIRLPNLALAYSPPRLPASPKTRSDFGIDPEAFVYLSSQSLFKYLPRHDHVFPAIARRVPQSQFVFLAHSNPELTGLFKQRLADVFKAFGLPMEKFCVFLPRLNFSDFLSLNLASDVLLDTFCWSGGKTTLEGIRCGLPVVTCPGKFMRGRHAYAFLKMMGFEDTIADNERQYIEIAVKMGRHRRFYLDSKQWIMQNRRKLYKDGSCIRALEDFYRRVIHGDETSQDIAHQQKERNHKRGIELRSIPKAVGPTPPADAKIYAAKGDQFFRSNCYEDAIANYQKSLACIPDYLGIQPWFMQYLYDGSRPPSYSKYFVADIYQALAICLYNTQRWDDALFAIQAALSMDPSNETIYNLKVRIEADYRKTSQMACYNIRQPEIPGSHKSLNVEKKITIMMMTHLSRKLKANSHLSPPGSGLVEATYASVLKVFGRSVAACTKLLCYDHPNNGHYNETVYQQNLEKFAGNQGFDLTVQNNCGLQKCAWQMLKSVNTPYLLFLEHDWEFQGPGIDIAALIDVFDRHENINYVRFNKRRNVIAGFDFILEKESLVPDVNLIRTIAHSNNPFIVRVAKLRQEWLPSCLNDPMCQQFDLRGQAFGIEDPLFKQHIQDVRRMGFNKAHKYWGTYVFGKINDPPRIVHLGE